MKLIDFVNKYINSKVDYDKFYGAQCVDLFRQYCKDVLELPHTGAVEGAKDLYINYCKLPKEVECFYRYTNKIRPKYGDVVVWDKTKTNQYGHVAIYLANITTDSILVFEQNGFTQEGAKLNVRSKENILGYLRKR